MEKKETKATKTSSTKRTKTTGVAAKKSAEPTLKEMIQKEELEKTVKLKISDIVNEAKKEKAKKEEEARKEAERKKEEERKRKEQEKIEKERKAAEEKKRKEAEEKARIEAEKKAKKEAAAKKRAETLARKKAEKEAREAEEARKEEERKQKLALAAQKRAETLARKKAEKEAQLAAEEKARKEAIRKKPTLKQLKELEQEKKENRIANKYKNKIKEVEQEEKAEEITKESEDGFINEIANEIKSTISEDEVADTKTKKKKPAKVDKEKLQSIKKEINKNKKDSKVSTDQKGHKRGRIFRNIFIAVIAEIYFILILVGNTNIPTVEYLNALKVFIVVEIIASLVLLEIGYTKDKLALWLHGTEIVGIAAGTMILLNLFSRQSPKSMLALIIIEGVIVVYYVIKAIAIAIKKEKQEYKV